MRPSFFKRVKRAIYLEFQRIRDEHRSTGRRIKKPPLSVRFRYWFRKIRENGIRFKRRRPKRPPLSIRFKFWLKRIRENGIRFERRRPKRPPLSIRFKFWLNRIREKKISFKRRSSSERNLPPLSIRIKFQYDQVRKFYAVVFSSKHLIITLNSLAIFLSSFLLIHFLTHLLTAIGAGLSNINTVLGFSEVIFLIHYWQWSEEQVITVFSIPAIFALGIALLTTIPFAQPSEKKGYFLRFRLLTKKQRQQHKQIQHQKELELLKQKLSKTVQPAENRKYKKRLSWPVRLFFLWTFYHCTTYFFSGLLYGFFFHRRLSYVIWWVFDNYILDAFFSIVAILFMIALGYVFSVQFFYTARMYFNDLNDRNRMQFVLSQALLPFIAGTVITTLLQLPAFNPALILLNFSMFFLLLPLPYRAVHFDSLHFDSREKTTKIDWDWIVLSLIIILAITIALNIGIPINMN